MYQVSEQTHSNLIASCLMSNQNFMIFCNDRIEWQFGDKNRYINGVSKHNYRLVKTDVDLTIFEIVKPRFLWIKEEVHLFDYITNEDVTSTITYNGRTKSVYSMDSVYDFFQEYLINKKQNVSTLKFMR